MMMLAALRGRGSSSSSSSSNNNNNNNDNNNNNNENNPPPPPSDNSDCDTLVCFFVVFFICLLVQYALWVDKSNLPTFKFLGEQNQWLLSYSHWLAKGPPHLKVKSGQNCNYQTFYPTEAIHQSTELGVYGS